MLCTVARNFRGSRIYLARFKLEADKPKFHWTSTKSEALRIALATAIKVMNAAVVFCPTPYLVDKKGRIIATVMADMPRDIRPWVLHGEHVNAYGGTLRALGWMQSAEARMQKEKAERLRFEQFTPKFTPPLILRRHRRASVWEMNPALKKKVR